MDAVEKLRAKGLHDVATELLRCRNELIVARRSLLVAHQINEEYRTKLESFDGQDRSASESAAEDHRLMERCAELTKIVETMTSERRDLEDRLAQSSRSLALAMRTAQEEADARARAEGESERLRSEREQALVHEQEDAPVQPEKMHANQDTLVQETIRTLESRLEVQRQAIEATDEIRSENAALKQRTIELEAQLVALSNRTQNATSVQSELTSRLHEAEAEKRSLEQVAHMSKQAIATLEGDLEATRIAIETLQADKAQMIERNVALLEETRALKRALDAQTAHPSENIELVHENRRGACLNRQDEGGGLEHASALVARSLLEQAIANDRLADKTCIDEIMAVLEDRSGQRALACMLERERGRMIRRVLAALSEEV